MDIYIAQVRFAKRLHIVAVESNRDVAIEKVLNLLRAKRPGSNPKVINDMQMVYEDRRVGDAVDGVVTQYTIGDSASYQRWMDDAAVYAEKGVE